MGGSETHRWVVAALMAFVLLAGGVAVAAGGADDRRTGTSAASPRAKLLTTSQRNAVRLGYIRARLRVSGAGVVRLTTRARRLRTNRTASITVPLRVKAKGAGRRTFRLRLTSRGRRLLRTCDRLHLELSGRSSRGRMRTTRVALRRDTVRCRSIARKVPGPSGTAPGGAPPAGGGGGGGEDISAPPGGPPLGTLKTDNADRCDFLDPSLCLYPFPNDHFTVADANTATKKRLNLNLQSVPRNRENKPIDPSDQNRGDGFSPGNKIITKVPGLETQAAFDQTGAVPITDMARSFDPDQPVVVINARTKERQLIWAEVDANPVNDDGSPDPGPRTLIIRPGKNFEEGERYIVALRNLKNAEGEILKPREEFRAYRDGIKTDNAAIEARRAGFESIFKDLGAAGIARKDLYLAWDFTVASEKSLAGRALTMRDDAFKQLGDTNLADLKVEGSSPRFVMNPDIPDSISGQAGDQDGKRDFTPEQNAQTARRITGQITVPCYLEAPGCPPGSGFLNGQPVLNPANTTTANVICNIPRQALDGGGDSPKVRPSLYGHGLLGSAGEVRAGNVGRMGQEHGYMFCATDWVGMSTTDLPNVATLLQDLSRFNTLVDRIQQGYVNFMYLGRWMIHPQGASANPAFQVGGRSVINTERLFYDGNSQGGILSGGLTALTPDFVSAVHGVPGMNYSTLLRRSVDFDMYAEGNFGGAQTPVGLYDNYPNELERPLILSMIQLLWDRGESNGYAQHMTTDPLPNSPQHKVLLHPAFGDHQVANVTADVEARTIGACTFRPALYPGRSPDVTPLYGIPTAGDPACHGSGITYWDGGPLGRIVNGSERGTPAPPTQNVPPRLGRDPHSYPRDDVKGRQQKADFLSVPGAFTDRCFGGPCYADGFTGP